MRPGEGIVIVNFAAGDGRIGCGFACPYCVWERSPDRARFISPPQGALEAFLRDHATEVLAVNGGGDPLHDVDGAGGRELRRILGTARAAGRRTTVRTRDAGAAASAPAELAAAVGAWKFSAPVGVSRQLLAALARYPGSEVSMVVGSRTGEAGIIRAARAYAGAGSPVVVQGDYLDPAVDNERLRAVAAEAGAAYEPNYFTDSGAGKAFLVGAEVRRGDALGGP